MNNGRHLVAISRVSEDPLGNRHRSHLVCMLHMHYVCHCDVGSVPHHTPPY